MGAGAAEAAVIAGGPGRVKVVVTAAVVEPIISCVVLGKVVVLRWFVGVTRGTHSSHCSLYGAPRPVGSIRADALQMV